MSLPQMRNPPFHFDLHPDKAYLSSPVLGIKNMVLKVARSTHLILDLLDICHHMWNVKFEKHKKVSFFTNGIRFECGNIAKGEEALTVNDEWVLDEEKMELIRRHKRDRHETYLPTTSPIPDEFLDSKRKAIYEFKKSKKLGKEDQWKSTMGNKQPFTKAAWKGKPNLKILPGGLENRTAQGDKGNRTNSWLRRLFGENHQRKVEAVLQHRYHQRRRSPQGPSRASGSSISAGT